MAKKRKSENAALNEVEKTLYNSFSTAANSISQLYTHAQNQQKIAFQAGERHGVVSTGLCGKCYLASGMGDEGLLFDSLIKLRTLL